SGGSTLLPQGQVVLGIRALPLQPPCEVDADLMNVAKDDFDSVVGELAMASGAPALQLGRLSEMGAVIRSTIDKRIQGRRLPVEADWRQRLDEHLAAKGGGQIDELEEGARAEKTAA